MKKNFEIKNCFLVKIIYLYLLNIYNTQKIKNYKFSSLTLSPLNVK